MLQFPIPRFQVHRYTMTKAEILACADFAWQQGMGTLMLQSGELPTRERIECVGGRHTYACVSSVLLLAEVA